MILINLFRAGLPILICSLPLFFSGCDSRSEEVSSDFTLDPTLSTVHASSAQTPPETVEPVSPSGDVGERIRAISLQQAAAEKSISSYRLKVTWEERRFEETPLDQPLPEGVLYSSGEGTLTWQAGKWRVEHRNRLDRIDGIQAQIFQGQGLRLNGRAEPARYDLWAVYNGEYFAQRLSKFGHSIYWFAPERTVPQAFLFPNPLEFGFHVAPRNGTLEAMLTTSQLPAHQEVTRWAIESPTPSDEVPGGIRMVRTIDTEHGPWKTAILIDPARDFLAVGMENWDPPHENTTEYHLDLQQLADGRWFPAGARYREKTRYRVWTFSDIEVNIPIDVENFEFESIPVDLKIARLVKQTSDGSDKVYLFRDGQWVPESLVPKHLRPAPRSQVH